MKNQPFATPCYTANWMQTARKWVRVAAVEELPESGAGYGFKVDGLDIAVFHWDQRFYALENFCPHLGFPLTEGLVQDGVVICGWHGWRVRLEDGGCAGKAPYARAYACEVRDNDVYVEVPETPEEPGQA